MHDAAREIAALVQQNRKIDAIRRLREETGLDLKAAVAAIEHINSEATAAAVLRTAVAPISPPPEAWPASLPLEVQLLAQRGQRVAAIRRLRELRGLRLGEAKRDVDAAFPPSPEQMRAMGVVVRTVVRLGLIALVVLLSVAGFLLLQR